MDIGKEGEVGSRVRNGKSKVGGRNLEGGVLEGKGTKESRDGVWRKRDYGEERWGCGERGTMERVEMGVWRKGD